MCTTDTADPDTAVFIGGPLSGQLVTKTKGARRQPSYRDDLGRPLQAHRGDTEFSHRPLNGLPVRRHYVLQTGYGGSPAYVHADCFDAWKEASIDERDAAVFQHRRAADLSAMAPRQIRGAATVAARLSDPDPADDRSRWDRAA